MEKITTTGIDLAKNVFSLHGVDASGKVLLRRTVGPRYRFCLKAHFSEPKSGF